SSHDRRSRRHRTHRLPDAREMLVEALFGRGVLGDANAISEGRLALEERHEVSPRPAVRRGFEDPIDAGTAAVVLDPVLPEEGVAAILDELSLEGLPPKLEVGLGLSKEEEAALGLVVELADAKDGIVRRHEPELGAAVVEKDEMIGPFDGKAAARKQNKRGPGGDGVEVHERSPGHQSSSIALSRPTWRIHPKRLGCRAG